MPLLGQAALAMWWDMAAERRAEFEDWHSHEHLPERLGLPGFRRGSRWADAAGGEGFFVLYELAAHDVLASPSYLARLNDPTPWSRKMMPHHRGMVRSQCRVMASHGAGLGRALLTVRLAPQPGRADELGQALRAMLTRLPERPGFVGGHLLFTEAPAIAQTEEQKIRGGDGAADWIILLAGYDARLLRGRTAGEFGAEALHKAGAQPEAVIGLYNLCHAVTPDDL